MDSLKIVGYPVSHKLLLMFLVKLLVLIVTLLHVPVHQISTLELKDVLVVWIPMIYSKVMVPILMSELHLLPDILIYLVTLSIINFLMYGVTSTNKKSMFLHLSNQELQLLKLMLTLSSVQEIILIQ